jgi:aminobenzoyl-glutamate utilization protein B
VKRSWDYFRDVQTKNVTYKPMMRPEDRPATELNAAIMDRFRPAMRRFYYEPGRYRTYLEQLGVSYPTVRRADGSCPAPSQSTGPVHPEGK